MELEKSLVDAFVKNASNNRKEIATSNIIYGTAIQSNGTIYVKIDGSDSIIPVTKAVDAESGDRVTVTIENHKAILTGNITNPASLKKIKAEEGYIGGYVITKDQIYNSDGGYGKCVGLGTPNTGWAFYAGANSKDDINGALFRVGHDGKLYAIDAELTGSITTGINVDGETQRWAKLSSGQLLFFEMNESSSMWESGYYKYNNIRLSNGMYDYIDLATNKIIFGSLSHSMSASTRSDYNFISIGDYNDSVNMYHYTSGYHAFYIGTKNAAGMFAGEQVAMMYIDSSGVSSQKGFTKTSDERIKTDFKHIDDRFIDNYMTLNPIKYRLKNDDTKKYHFGFKAQEIKDTFQKYGDPVDEEYDICVERHVDPEQAKAMYDEDDMDTIYSLRYDEIIPLNTHMIQKLLKQNEELQNRVSILEQKLEAKGDENANIKI